MYPAEGVDFITKNPNNSKKLLSQDEIRSSRFFSIKSQTLGDRVDDLKNAQIKDNPKSSVG